MKILTVIVGIFFGALVYLQSQSIIAINWTELDSLLETSLSIFSNTVSDTSLVSNITGNLGIPLIGGHNAS